MFYGAPVWDPALIVAQIVTLQCLFYLSLGALLFLFVGARARVLGPSCTACSTSARALQPVLVSLS